LAKTWRASASVPAFRFGTCSSADNIRDINICPVSFRRFEKKSPFYLMCGQFLWNRKAVSLYTIDNASSLLYLREGHNSSEPQSLAEERHRSPIASPLAIALKSFSKMSSKSKTLQRISYSNCPLEVGTESRWGARFFFGGCFRV
jgi:hypothetical protein